MQKESKQAISIIVVVVVLLLAVWLFAGTPADAPATTPGSGTPLATSTGEREEEITESDTEAAASPKVQLGQTSDVDAEAVNNTLETFGDDGVSYDDSTVDPFFDEVTIDVTNAYDF